MTEVCIANLTDKRDGSAIIAILEEYARSMDETLDVPAEAVLDGLRESGNCLTWLAWSDNQPVGLAICFRTFSTFAGKPVLNIHDLAVRMSQRSRGIGTALLSAIIADVAARGYGRVTLEVRDDHPDAVRLYRRLGFSDPEGRPTRSLSLSLNPGSRDSEC